MEGSGICTACGASAELNAEGTCPDCAGGSMESQPQPEADQPSADAAEEAAPAEGEVAPAEDGGEEAAA